MADTTDRSLLNGLLGDGRPALGAVGAALAFAGGLAVYLGVTRQLLPHDLAYLGLTAAEIDAVGDGRLMDFMVHDRVAWGGTLLAIGLVYMWLVAFPISAGHRWAWQTLALTGAMGFASFLSYLPSGYLDTWHGLGTLLLIPVFLTGILKSRTLVAASDHGLRFEWRSINSGRQLVLATGAGLAISGLIIMTIGITVTFVPSDLDFIGLTDSELRSISGRLVPLIAHDRIGFAGGVVVSGFLIALVSIYGRGRAALQVLTLAGIVGFGLATAIHLAVGYTDALHLAPTVVGPSVMAAGLAMWWRANRAFPELA